MRLLDAQVDWMEGYGNPAKLRVLVGETPARSELRFEHDDGLWYAEKDGYAGYLSWTGPGNEGGYSGRCFEIMTADGEQVTRRGPYSSRAECANLRFGPVVDVALTTNPETLMRGHTLRSAALTLPAAEQAIDLVDEASHLERRFRCSNNEPYWIPVRENVGDD